MSRRPALLVTSTFPRHPHDPVGRFLLELLRAMKRELTVVAPDDPQTAAHPLPGARRVLVPHRGLFYGAGAVANVRNRRRSRPGAALDVMRFLRATTRNAPGHSVIWSHWALPAGLAGARAGRRHRIPHLLSLHGGDVWLLASAPGGRALARYLARRCAAITAPRAGLADTFADLSGRRPLVLPLGVHGVERPPRSDRPLRLGCLSRLVPGKGLRALVRHADGLPGELLIAGDGPLASELASAALPRPNVRLVGPLVDDDKRAFLASLDGFVAPYGPSPWGQTEGLPVAVLEALAAGLPVLAFASSCPGDTLRHEGNALLVDDGDVAALVNASQRLAHDAGLLAALAATARASAAPFAMSTVAPAWNALLDALADGTDPTIAVAQALNRDDSALGAVPYGS